MTRRPPTRWLTGWWFICALLIISGLSVAGSSVAAAQGPPPLAPPPPPSPPPPPPPLAAVSQTPLMPMALGSAAIRGRVLDGATPVGRALVKLTMGSETQSRSAMTDGQGRFGFEQLPAGRFTVTASKPAYITSAFGATRPGRPGTTISLAAGQTLDSITVGLPKGGVIAGVITDNNGEPMPGVLIGYLWATGTQAASGESYRSDWTTDDRGAFRIYGLEPGTYFIVAGWRTSPSTIPVATLQTGEVDVALSELAARRSGTRVSERAASPRALVQYVGQYYPGTPDIGQASPIAIGTGEVRADVNFALSPVPSASIEGVVRGAGATLPPLVISLTPVTPSRLPPYLVVSPTLNVRPGADGKFRYTGVAPGRYTLAARSQPATDSVNASITTTGANGAVSTSVPAPGRMPSGVSGDALYASLQIAVDGTDLTGLSLDLAPAPRIHGRVEFDAAALTPPPDPTIIRVLLNGSTSRTFVGTIPGSTTGTMSFNARETSPNAFVDTGKRFEIAGAIPDTYTVSASVPGQRDWRLRSAIVDGRDVLDTGFTIGDAPTSEIVLAFTDRHSELSGVLQTPAGAPATDYFVVVFTTDRALWKPQARRLVFTRPASDGKFSIANLPAGEYFLAALTDLDPADWQNPAFLDTVVPASLKIAIADGETKRQDLRLAQ